MEDAGTTIGRNRSASSVSLRTLNRLVPGALDTYVFAKVAPGANPSAVGGALRTALTGHPEVAAQDHTAYKASGQARVDDLVNLVYALLALAIVIAILSVVNTLALSVVERTREIGLLRAIGTARPQIRRMIQLESVVIAVFGCLTGLALGLSWAVALQPGALTVPWLTIAMVIASAGLVGLLAALAPAERAARMNILAAISSG
jgi:putative ABC transport system permease protein